MSRCHTKLPRGKNDVLHLFSLESGQQVLIGLILQTKLTAGLRGALCSAASHRSLPARYYSMGSVNVHFAIVKRSFVLLVCSVLTIPTAVFAGCII
eukprot:scaffold4529_cov44-Prasinocladus_malaysianus.AAC.2